MARRSVEPLDYTIQGDNLQVVRIRLKPGQEVFAEAGKMVYKTANVTWETRMTGETLGQKIWGALKRKVMGESLFLTYFRSSGNGEVGFAGNYPGRLQVFDLAAGQSVMAQRDSFIVAQTTVQFNVALVKKLGAGFFGGEGFILEKLTGPGTVFIHGGGDFVEFELQPGRDAPGGHRLHRGVRRIGELRHPVRGRNQDGAVRRRRSVPGDAHRPRPRDRPEHDAGETAARADSHADRRR